MNKTILLCIWIFSFISNTLHAQIFNPVKWEASIQKVEGTVYRLEFIASIEEDWHIYSLKEYPEDAIAPIPLSFKYPAKDSLYTLVEGPVESETVTSYNDVFKLDETYFKDKAHLSQKVELIEASSLIKVEIQYQVCKEVCLNESAYFIFNPAKMQAKVVEASVFVEGDDHSPKIVPTIPPITGNTTAITETTSIHSDISNDLEDGNFWALFIVSFLSGFAALLTPCVFPMIPMTVSFFTKKGKTKALGIRNAILYAVFIIVIYVGLGSVVTAIFGADALNSLSTNVWFNLIFFALLSFM